MLRVENLTKNFGTKLAVNNISFTVQPGVITGLLGLNGAGKTTTMRLITGFIEPSSGHIYYNEQNTIDDPIWLKQKLGYLPESAPLYPDMLVREYLEFMAEVRHLPDPLKKVQIEKMIDLCELSTHIQFPISQLSKGFKQRVALAGTLIHDPELIILDEPTSGLDPNQISHIRQLIKNMGKEKTLILSTHILQEVEDICEEVIIINRGEIVENSKVSDLHKRDRQVIISAKTDLITIKKVLNTKEIDSVELYAEESPSDGFTLYKVILSENKPESVYKALQKTEIEVREIKINKKSLSSIFEELTRK